MHAAGKTGRPAGQADRRFGYGLQPQTDDVRDSQPADYKTAALCRANVTVLILDKKPRGLAETTFRVEWASSPHAAAQGKDALLSLTAWPSAGARP